MEIFVNIFLKFYLFYVKIFSTFFVISIEFILILPCLFLRYRLYSLSYGKRQICNKGILYLKTTQLEYAQQNCERRHISVYDALDKQMKYVKAEYRDRASRFRDVMNRDAIPAIIPQALFDRAQILMKKNQKASARGKAEIEYILTTKLKCGRCGNLMVGESGKSATGTVYHYYKCSHAKRKMGCQKKAVRKEWIEDLAVRYAMQIVMDDSLIHTIAERVMGLWNQENTRLPQLQARLKETERHIQNMLNAIQQGILTPSTKQRLDELEQTKQEIEVAICQEQIKNPSITKEEIICYIKKLIAIIFYLFQSIAISIPIIY